MLLTHHRYQDVRHARYSSTKASSDARVNKLKRPNKVPGLRALGTFNSVDFGTYSYSYLFQSN